ncbi:DNA-directed RNA polymerase I subunit RPA43 [Octopus bimaculoides]|uniref:RPA43 OB domain-containing protein n=1 Tax=Octopus bimaculoides TaxID=37653 RepID=A0A0L8I009_OCTBM|nr:DNA-directed RNA polymerase I subunit RPA43 [Octopus bimaculoides]|eukprot:XP_014767920.1 PREDICTED: DNA-directed RNA polymerase I subunit RPA43-like [Octopus bimaculoides]
MFNNLALGIEKAKLLLDDPASLCIQEDSEEEIAIPPAFIGKLNEGIRFRLNTEINTFSHRLNGVILAYKDLKLLSSEGRIQGDRPFIYFKMKISYILFQPKIGSTLTGVIKEIYASHVVCVVHELFNATVIKSSDDATWNINAFRVSNLIEFTVTDLHSTPKLFSMKGKLIRRIETNSLVKQDKKAKKRHRDVESEDVCPDSEKLKIENHEINGHTLDVINDSSSPVKKKKKKKKKVDEDN